MKYLLFLLVILGSYYGYQRYAEDSLREGNSREEIRSKYYDHRSEYKNLRKLDSVEAHSKFLEKNPQSDWTDSVIYYRDRAALNEAKIIATVEAFEEFIRKYPDSDWIDQAVNLKNRAALL